MQRYLDEVRTGFAIEPEPHNVFLDKTGLPTTPDQFSRRVTKYIKEADIGKCGSCHLFRHTVATLTLDNGADIRFIQQNAGACEYWHHGDLHPRLNREAQADPRNDAPDFAPETQR